MKTLREILAEAATKDFRYKNLTGQGITSTKAYVVHPDWKLSENTPILITDKTKEQVKKLWDLEDDDLQDEFGGDGCIFPDSVKGKKYHENEI